MLRGLIIVAIVVTASVGFPQEIGGPTEEIATTEEVLTTENDPKVLLETAKELLAKINKDYGEWSNKEVLASWKYDSNLTDENLAEKINISSQAATYRKKLWEEVKAFPWKELQDEDAKRQFSKFSIIGEAALPEELFEEYANITSQMSKIYSTAKICELNNPKKCDLSLEPQITELVAKSRDPELLKHIWIEWRKNVGEKMKPFFPRYVELGNLAAKLNDYGDKSEAWLHQYEAEDFQEQIESLWQELKPLYLQIHAYVRAQLRKKYGDDVVSKDGPIPAHLLGNMWAQSWDNVADFTLPFPGKNLPNPTEAMVAQGYNPTKIFQLAESCFVSMNMSAMPELFWKNSILEKPTDREIVCHASAWDFFDGQDFRIKQCTVNNADSLETAHHEMGHIQYFLQYKDQPTVYKEGANPGFHEAVGDVMSLSVSTPAHLQKIKLLENYTTDDEASLNHLYLKGLEKVVFLPFAYIMDLWRWDIFRGEVTPDQYNCYWWKLAEEFQGIEPPIDRTEEDFDAASKYHIISDVEYLRYYVSFVVQFQFHRSLCIEAGEYNPEDPNTKPLHECDITDSKKAGNLMKSMLKLGSSKPWQDAMEVLTGQRKMCSSGLLDYFKPLLDWLTAENQKTNEYIGWKNTSKRCVQTRGELV
ncbi:angiotensin-converting enzyme-like isoform X2 [Belonocnema kinseyi]|uniref:angiotensin-converting enzyme-like isoform X2 n=1 Tax=Belonocnema kinseyi TaxID=2817044 RepID=UPI00143DB096|nr:angiotensin-converting enzyme-like isoform X2 [Belonocnema kinseyi]